MEGRDDYAGYGCDEDGTLREGAPCIVDRRLQPAGEEEEEEGKSNQASSEPKICICTDISDK